ncbi:MAG TPA: hypothetical protein VJU84_16785 [Pyrinomonadaceae bacterium]|nr:hypothetical protein [Pyrinomonadaceae bacterium]
MKARLFAIFANVIAPPHLASFFIEGVEDASAGTDVNRILRDRGNRENSTAGLILPFQLRFTRLKMLSSFLLTATNSREHQ